MMLPKNVRTQIWGSFKGGTKDLIDNKKAIVKSSLYSVIGVDLYYLNQIQNIMAVLRDLIQGNALTLFITQGLGDQDQIETALKFQYSLLVICTDIIGVNAIASIYGDTIEHNSLLNTFFTEVIGQRYNKARDYYTGRDTTYSEITTTDLSTIANAIGQIAVDLYNTAVAFTEYLAIVGTAQAILEPVEPKSESLLVSPETVIGYSNWDSIISASGMIAVLAEAIARKTASAYAPPDVWYAFDAFIIIYWRFLSANIIYALQLEQIAQSTQPKTIRPFIIYGPNSDTPYTQYATEWDNSHSYQEIKDLDHEVEGNKRGYSTSCFSDTLHEGTHCGVNGYLCPQNNVTTVSAESTIAQGFTVFNTVRETDTENIDQQKQEIKIWERIVEVYISEENEGSEWATNPNVKVFTTHKNDDGTGGYDIEFTVSGSNLANADTATVTLYNLAEDTYKNFIKDKSRILIKAGYENDYGPIFEGTIEEINKSWSGGDEVIQITCYDTMSILQYSDVVTYVVPIGESVYDTVKNLCATCGITTAYVEPPGLTSSTQATLVGKPYQCILNVVRHVNGVLGYTDMEANAFTFYIKNNIGYFVQRKYYARDEVWLGDEDNNIPASENGLLEESPSDDESEMVVGNIKTMLNWRLKTDTTVHINGIQYKGTYKVMEYTHTCSGKKQFYTDATLWTV